MEFFWKNVFAGPGGAGDGRLRRPELRQRPGRGDAVRRHIRLRPPEGMLVRHQVVFRPLVLRRRAPGPYFTESFDFTSVM